MLVKVASRSPALVYFTSPNDTTPAGKISLRDARVETLDVRIDSREL